MGKHLVKRCRYVSLLYKAFCQAVVRTALLSHHLCAIECDLLSTVAFSTSILLNEHCMSLSALILSGTYPYPFATNLSKTYLAVALAIPWTVFISIAWLFALNGCTRFSELVAWCKMRWSPINFDVHVCGMTHHIILCPDSPLGITVSYGFSLEYSKLPMHSKRRLKNRNRISGMILWFNRCDRSVWRGVFFRSAHI